MIPFNDVFRCLLQTFDGSAVDDFRRFLERNSQVRKWFIAADYCLRDKDKANSVFALTVFPYDDHLQVMQAEIKAALPRDIKKSKEVTQEGIELLRDPRRFHFAFVFKEHPDIYAVGAQATRLETARESLKLAINQLKDVGRTKPQLRRLNALQQKSLSASFNVTLLSDLTVLSILLCLVTLLIQRERPSELVSWFSDRDNMTTWGEGAIWDIAVESVAGLSEHVGIPLPMQSVVVAEPDKADAGSPWFDDLIRLPDFIAGLFASWDHTSNMIDAKVKYGQLALGVAAQAQNLAVLNVRWGKEFQVGRLVYSANTPPAAHEATPGAPTSPSETRL